MKGNNTISTELEHISPTVANLGKDQVYSVPNGYFEGLAACILQKIRAEELLTKATSATYTVPDGYFEQLPQAILQQLHADSVTAELNEVAPVLNNISKAPVYTVPDGYFNQFGVSVTAQSSGKVVRMTVVRRWVSYAAAAVFAGVAITGLVWLLLQNGSKQPTVAEIEKARSTNIPEVVNNIPEEAITAFLNTHTNTSDVADNELNSNPNEVDFNQFIETATDEDIINYLNEHEVADENVGKGI